MKIIVIANNLTWSSWNTKIQLLKDWYKDCVELTIDLKHVNFSNIPFDRNVQVNRIWMEQNIIPLAKGYDLVYFQMNTFDWKAYPVQAAYLGEIGGIQVIEGGCDEYGDYNFVGFSYPGDLWFNLARHEVSHALYFKQGKLDNTHIYWETNMIEKVLQELKQTTMKYKYFTEKEIVGLSTGFVIILDKARDIAQTPFKITSGFRSQQKNAQVGGVPNSSHTKGLAVDLACTDNFKRTLILKGLYNCGTDLFIEICKSHIHVDMDKSIHKLGQTMWALDD